MTEPLIVFVCTANICRSPWAELRGRQLLDGFRVASAGVLPNTVGRSMDPVMAATLPREVSGDQHRAQMVSPQLISDATLILAMEAQHRVWLIDEFPGATRKIFTLGQFVATIANAPGGLSLDELLTWAYRNRVAPSARYDVEDPYKQGPDKALAAAKLLDEQIRRVADVLVPAVAQQP